MRKIIVLTMVAMLAFPLAVQAAGKIGVVNMQRIIATSEAGQEVRKQLAEKFKGMKSDLDSQKADLDKIQKELQKQSFALSQAAKMDKEVEFKRKVRDFQDTRQTYIQKMKLEEDRLSGPVIETVMKVIQDYGKKNGFDIIVDGRQAGLLYADEAVNVTNAVLVEVNKAWRAKPKK